MHPIQFAVSIVLFLVLFFGIGFLLNMLLKTTWLPGMILYPLVVILMISDVSWWQYGTQPVQSFQHLGDKLTSLWFVDYVILLSGLVGAIMSGITIKILRAKGYRMF